MRDDAAHRQQLLFSLRKSVRYHNARRRHYERLHSGTAAVCVLFATASMFAILSNLGPYWAAGTAAVVSVAATADLVVGTSAKVRMHHDLVRRFVALEKSVLHKLHPNAFDLRQWEAERLDIQADEPPLRQVLDVMAANDLLLAYGADASQLTPVRWYQRWLAPVVDVHVHRLAHRGPKDDALLAAVEPEDALAEA